MSNSEPKKEEKCRLKGWKALGQKIPGANFLAYIFAIWFIIQCSRRSRKHTVVLPSKLSFRIYGGGYSCAQIKSVALWSYGIPTLLTDCYFGVEKNADGECIEFIESEFLVPSTRVWQADILLRQWFNHRFVFAVMTTPVKYHNGIPSTQYANNQPMVPHGIPYKPIWPDSMFITLFSFVFNGIAGSHKSAPKEAKQRQKESRKNDNLPLALQKESPVRKSQTVKKVSTPKKRKTPSKTPKTPVKRQKRQPKKAKLW